MSDIFKVLNLADQTAQTAPDGGTVHLNIPANIESEEISNYFVVSRTDSMDTSNAWLASGQESIAPPAPADVDSAYPIARVLINHGRKAGVVTTAALQNSISGSGTIETLHLVFHYVDDFGQLAAPVSWLTAGVLDLQWEQFTGRISSASLATFTEGLKQGSDVLFGVVTFQAGALIITGITTMSLCIRPALDLEGYGPFILDTTAVDQVDLTGGHKYYRVNFNLASDALTAAFGELNDTLAQALAGTDQTAILNAQKAAAKIPCILELRATHTSGIYTSLSYPLNILQALAPS